MAQHKNEIAETAPLHPGTYIKESIFPKELSVKEAAMLLGVGRPALSNLLNGKAALSPEMALRIEKAFGVKSVELLELQAQFDGCQMIAQQKDIKVRTYAPSMFDIHARQINAWADEQLEARSLLPALLRRLVNTTGQNLEKVDFPAYDNAQRHGWDGQIETDSATPWIPSGKSGWEFGVNKRPTDKANKDYETRTRTIPKDERQETTFVFVTPRNWPGKNDWVKTKQEQSEWRDVKAYDASDLEQWLEQSIPAQSWFAEQLGVMDDNILSLDQCWQNWASVTEPELNKELFTGSVEAHRNKLAGWLSKEPDRPFIVVADSVNEALAFLVCVFEVMDNIPLIKYDQVIVIRSSEALKTVEKGYSKFITVIASVEAEEVITGMQKKRHMIIVRHKGLIEGEPDITLDIPNYEIFKTSLIAMEINELEVEQHARQSGQSPTILRRRLSQIPAIKYPSWSQDDQITKKLIPMVLAGVWKANNRADQEILECLSRGSKYKTIEEAIAEILKQEDSPLWSIGNSRGVISKVDALFAVKSLITNNDIENFFLIANYVLSEEDPALDLPEKDRWAAAIYDKTRDHSGVLRQSLCETLVLLSVHGNNLFQDRLGIDIESMVNNLIRDLLKPFNPRTWQSQQSDLPRYAEAAPRVFIEILEEDLNSDDPQILSLLVPTGSDIFSRCPRTGLLWALELLAWKADRLVRVVAILARLSKIEINDNWANKPINSLKAIFRSWMPQTAASIKERMKALEVVTDRFPEIGWQLCIGEFKPGSSIGRYSNRPKWRNDAAGAGQSVDNSERKQFVLRAIDMTINWPTHDEKTLGDLVERLQIISEEDVEKVWQNITKWLATNPSEVQKAELREKVRRYTFTRRGHKRNLNEKLIAMARDVYQSLSPEDPVINHQWLFAKHWVDESIEELDDEEYDFEKREERIGRQRIAALQEIWGSGGLTDIKRLITTGDATNVVGWHLARDILESTDSENILHDFISDLSEDIEFSLNECIAGILSGSEVNTRNKILEKMIQQFTTEGKKGESKIIRLLRCASFKWDTWRYVEKLPGELQRRYWIEVHPRWAGQDATELKKLIDCLLNVGRPMAAFSVAHLKWKEIESDQLIRLLNEVPKSSNEPAGYYQISSYEVDSALKTLGARANVSQEELAHLEFQYIEILESGEYGIPNLEKQIAKYPQLFIQAIAIAFKRNDNNEDPPELLGPNVTHSSNAASAAYSLLENIKKMPGTNEAGVIDQIELAEWIREARMLCQKYARAKIGDEFIGKLLSHSAVGEDGVWPCEPVRQCLEDITSKDIAIGVNIGVRNARGVTWRGEGGQQERELAEKYRNWSQQLAFEYPYVSALVEQIAHSYDDEAKWWDTDDNVRKRTWN